MFVGGIAGVGSREVEDVGVEGRHVSQVRPQVGWELPPQPDQMREVYDPVVGLKGRG